MDAQDDDQAGHLGEARRRSEVDRRRRDRVRLVALVLVLTLLLSAAVLILLASQVCAASTSGLQVGCEGCCTPGFPLGSALGLGPAASGHNAPDTTWFENITITSASTDLTISDVAFTVQTEDGGVVTLPQGSAVDLVDNVTGETIVVWEFASATWAGAPLSTHVTEQDHLTLVWPASSATDPLSGDRLVVSGENDFAGSFAVTLA